MSAAAFREAVANTPDLALGSLPNDCDWCDWISEESGEEGFFSWNSCDSCSSSLGGQRYSAHDGVGYHYAICVDCVDFHAFGTVPEEWDAGN